MVTRARHGPWLAFAGVSRMQVTYVFVHGPVRHKLAIRPGHVDTPARSALAHTLADLPRVFVCVCRCFTCVCAARVYVLHVCMCPTSPRVQVPHRRVPA